MSPASRDSIEAATARIGARLTALRTARGIRVAELARRTGVSSSLISQIERGHSRPSVGTLFAIARVLEVPVDAFFEEPDGTDAEPAAAQDARPVATPANPTGNGADGTRAPAGPGDVVDDMATTGLVSELSRPVAAVDDVILSADHTAFRRPADGGDPYLVKRGQRASIDIRGGVRWERLTPTTLDGVEFMELVYAPGAESDRQAYRHPGVELVTVLQGTMTIFLGFARYDLEAGDSIAFPSTVPHRYVNLTDSETRAVTVILHDALSNLQLGQATEPDSGSQAT